MHAHLFFPSVLALCCLALSACAPSTDDDDDDDTSAASDTGDTGADTGDTGTETGDTGEALSWVQVAPGEVGTCALRSDGKVECWGRETMSDVPEGTFTQVAVGGDGACALDAEGVATCWYPVESCGVTMEPLTSFSKIDGGFVHYCGLSSEDGSIECWGAGEGCATHDFGQAESRSGPFVDVSAGQYVTCGLRTNGTTECWGLTATDFDNGGQYYQSVSVGLGTSVYAACGMTTAGEAECFGSGGETANGTGLYSEPSGIVQLGVGDGFACGLTANGTPVCWGGDSPSPYPGGDAPTDAGFTQIAAGKAFACALKDGQITCWGDNSWGQTDVPEL